MSCILDVIAFVATKFQLTFSWKTVENDYVEAFH